MLPTAGGWDSWPGVNSVELIGDTNMIGCTQATLPSESWHLTDPFTLVFRTAGASETVTILCQDVGVFRAWIDWGDRSAKTPITAYDDANLSHVYAVAGDYTAKIYGSFPNISYGDNYPIGLHLRNITSWGKVGFKSMKDAFRQCHNLGVISATDGGGSTMANVVSMENIFFNAFAFNGYVNNWNVRKVETMENMFRASSFNSDLNNWIIEKTTSMTGMFFSCPSFNKPLNTWNVSLVTNFGYMFYVATSFNQPLSNWHVSQVTARAAMDGMFKDAPMNQDLSMWDVSNIPSRPIDFSNSGTLIEPLWNT